jgi:hypothetical protein
MFPDLIIIFEQRRLAALAGVKMMSMHIQDLTAVTGAPVSQNVRNENSPTSM